MLYQGTVRPLLTNLVALAVALAVVPALAEEPTRGMKRARNDVIAEVAEPPSVTAPVQQAVETLHRLRLHPGQDSLDVAETARRRPHTDSE